jgi:hypothetical protein
VSQGPAPGYDAILHWNGAQWTKMTYPGQASGALLYAVTALSASDAWAVGTVTDHWDGTRWAKVPAPIPVGQNGPENLCAVNGDSSSDVWAVCGNLVLRWNGTRWTRVTPPRGISVSAVAAISRSDVWVVGSGGAPGKGLVTRAAHWDGTSWTRVPTPSPSPAVGNDAEARLKSVSAVATDDIWAVGSYEDFATGVEQGKSLALHWDGTRWTRVAIPNLGTTVVLKSVCAVSPSLAWAVGDTVTDSGGTFTYRNLLLEWNGTAWNRVPTPQPASPDGGFSTLEGLSASSASNAWAVGWYETSGGAGKTLMLHWNGTGWTRS